MKGMLKPSPIAEYNSMYSFDEGRHLINYIYDIKRDALFADLFTKLGDLI